MIPIKRFIAFSLTALMLLYALLSCGTGSGNQNENSQDTAGQTDTQDTSAQESERIYPDLPAQDFDGYVFKFLVRSLAANADWVEWDHRDLFAENITGDVINDAVFERNAKIGEKYNITISQTTVTDFTVTVSKMVKAGDDSFDIVCPHISEFPGMAQQGQFVDLLPPGAKHRPDTTVVGPGLSP